jgi:serine/threonine-protein kinase
LAERYRVEEVIGRGGMGVVLAAENTITRRRVAIKWLRSDLVDNAEAAERLVREASVASRIRHPNVVDVFDVLRDGTSIFLVMDLLQGESLEAVLHRGGIPVHELVSILVPAMKGVAEAHRQDIVHRDIHPGNIFLSRESHDPRPIPVVLDFGISKFGNITSGQRALTRSNMCMGTPLYMSYEQLYSARDVDARTDVYSFGVILYEGLTGKPPFDGESLMEVAGKITAGTPVHPKVLRPEIPTAQAELVLWAMARKREDRLPTIDAFIRELEPFATERAFRGQMTESDTPLPKVARSERFAEAIPVDDEVESIDLGPEPSRPPPPLRDGSASAARLRAEEPRVSASQPGQVAPPLTTLASRPTLAKEVDTHGQRSSELAQSLRPAVAAAGEGRRKTLGIAAAAALMFVVVATIAIWKFTDHTPTGASAESAASVATPEALAPVKTLPPVAAEPRPVQPAAGPAPAPSATVVPPVPPASEPELAPAPAAQLPAAGPSPGTKAAFPLRSGKLPAVTTKPPPPPRVSHRAGELGDDL